MYKNIHAGTKKSIDKYNIPHIGHIESSDIIKSKNVIPLPHALNHQSDNVTPDNKDTNILDKFLPLRNLPIENILDHEEFFLLGIIYILLTEDEPDNMLILSIIYILMEF
jgi:hypothetical protein